MNFTNYFLNCCFGTSTEPTATVYLNGENYATYSKSIAYEVAKELHGEVVDDETGEIIYTAC